MVEFTGTTPSEAGGNGQGGTTDFSSQLDAATLAAVGDQTVQQGGIASLRSDSADRDAIAAELVAKFPGLFSFGQAQRLVVIYNPGGFDTTAVTIQNMKNDGFLVDSRKNGVWSCNANNIDGTLIAKALFSAVNVDQSGVLNGQQFDDATDTLFGDNEGLTRQVAIFLSYAVGDSNGTLSVGELATIFDNDYLTFNINPGNKILDLNWDGPWNIPLLSDRSDNATTAAYMMLYDGALRQSDVNGVLSEGELLQALYRNPSDVPGTQSDQENVTRRLIACYGETDTNGQMVMGFDGLVAMLKDRAVVPDGNYTKFGTVFNVILQNIPIDRLIGGAQYSDGTSLINDGKISAGDLCGLFQLFGIEINGEQGSFLVKVYSSSRADHSYITADDVQNMRGSGFLEFNEFTIKGKLVWSGLDGTRVADALIQQIQGANPTTPEDAITASEFDLATDRLFGDKRGVTSENAEFLTRAYGTGGKLNRSQIAGIFNRENISVTAIPEQKFVWIHTNSNRANMVFFDNDTAANFIMFGDGNNDGVLSRSELNNIIKERLGYNGSIADAAMDTLMNCYGEKNSDGTMVVNRAGVMAMLNEGVLVRSSSILGDLTGFQINLDAIPIQRVIWGATFKDKESLYDGIFSTGELNALFDELKVSISPEQAQFLIKVYGNGTYVTAWDLQRMREDGFLETGTVAKDKCTLNWKNIDGEKLARAIFKNQGLDPDATDAAVRADQFSTGFKLLFGDIQTLKNAADLTQYFGFDDKLTVVQMDAALDAVNTDFSIPLANPDTGRFDIQEMVPAYNTTNWWTTVCNAAGGLAAGDMVTLIAAISGVNVDVVAGMLNGTLSKDVSVANGGYKIVAAISAAIKGGQAGVTAIIDTMSKALYASLGVLSDQGTALMTQLVTSAKTGGDEVAIRTLSMLAGMSVADARAEFETLTNKSSLLDFAQKVTSEEIQAMIPQSANVMAEAVKKYKDYMGSVQTDATALKALAAEGFTFNSDNKLMKAGQVLSEADAQAALSKFARVDIAIDVNSTTRLPAHISWGVINALQLRFIYCYSGDDGTGKPIWETRVRILAAATSGGKVAVGTTSFGIQAGVVGVHDLIIPFSGEPRETKWSSSLVVLGAQFNMNLSEAYYLAHAVQQEIGPQPTLPPPAPVGAETGGGWGTTVTFNLTKMGKNGILPFVVGLSGAVAGGVAGFYALGTLEAGTTAMTQFLTGRYGARFVNIGAMAGAFLAEYAYAGGSSIAGQTFATSSSGAFWWGATLLDLGEKDTNGNTSTFRGAIQINIGYSPEAIV